MEALATAAGGRASQGRHISGAQYRGGRRSGGATERRVASSHTGSSGHPPGVPAAEKGERASRSRGEERLSVGPPLQARRCRGQSIAVARRVLRYFVDTEHTDDGARFELISIAVVCEDGREYYAAVKGYDGSAVMSPPPQY